MILFRYHQLEIDELSILFGLEVSNLILALNFLKNEGFIKLTKIDDEKTTITLQEGGNCIIGLDLGGTKLYGAIADITGNILYDAEILNHGRSGEACFEMIVDLVDQLIRESKKRDLKLRGIGIDVPGRVQLGTGLVINAPAVNMKDFHLKERIESRFDCPTTIDNDLKQASLGEAWFGAGKEYRNMVLLAIGTGIAASVVIDGTPLRGAHARLGELGWMVPGRKFLGQKYVGFGALEREASGPGIVDRANKLLKESMDMGPAEGLTTEIVFKAARNGVGWAQDCIAETVDYLAILIANIMAFYDPDIIILSGGVSRSSEMLIPPIMRLIEGCVLTQPRMVTSTLGHKAGALGAIINLIQNCPEFIRSS